MVIENKSNILGEKGKDTYAKKSKPSKAIYIYIELNLTLLNQLLVINLVILYQRSNKSFNIW